MGKQIWKAGNMVYPLPAVLITVRDADGNDNVFTVAWAGTVCTNPAMLSISVRPERHSYKAIKETGVFALNLTTESLAYATDYCGVRSGRDEDKFASCDLHKEEAKNVNVPLIKESPVNIECRVVEEKELGSHTMFIAEVLAINSDKKYIDEKGAFDISKCNLISYANGGYYSMGKKLGKFGFSVKKNK